MHIIKLPKKPLLLLLLIAVLLCTQQVFAQLTANFSASITNRCAPAVINFSDHSTGNPTQWKWDLGNGTISTLQHPSVSYFNPGQYTIKLIVKNSAGQDSISKQNYITIHAGPIVSFSSSATRGCFPTVIQFNDATLSNNGILSTWEWDFGDGQIANTKNTQHTYIDSGIYNVTLKVTNVHGCVGTLQKTRLIEINGVKANFRHYVQNRCYLNKELFLNQSIGNGNLQYKWSFGDGNQSNLLNYENTYNNGGTYNAKLVVSNQFGCKDSVTKVVQVDTPMTARFTANATRSCRSPFTVQFNNINKQGNIYIWNFGDGNSSTDANPSHTYLDSGKYTVSLTVTNSLSTLFNCIDSVKKVEYIVIQKTQINMFSIPDSGCTHLVKKFSIDTFASGTINNYKWLFGDGTFSLSASPIHTYNNLGSYDITLITTTATGCTDTTKVTNAIKISTKPTANFNTNVFNACASTPISFTNLSSGANQWQWDFGDFQTSEDQHPSHKFKDTGYLNISLIAINGGCNDTLTINRYVYIKPAIAKFSFITNCTNNLLVKFLNTSIGGKRFLWDFGDGTTSTETSPTHLFANGGSYTIRLDAFNDSTGCNSFFIKSLILVKDTTTFIAANNNVCRGGSIQLIANTNRSSLGTYFWSFGDGSALFTTRNDTVAHVYNLPGVYTVKLIKVSTNNCRDTIIKPQLIMIDGPIAKFDIPTLGTCVNKALQIIDSSKSDGRNAIVSWTWDYGDSITQTITAPPFTHVYDSLGAFRIWLKVTDSKGCTDTIGLKKNITVANISSAFYPYDSITCPNKPITMVTPSYTIGFGYNWSFGDGTTANTQYVTKAYANPGIYTVKVILSNGFGCSDTTIKTNIIKVVQPESKFFINDSFKTCPPLIVQFTDSSKYAVTKVWDFGDGTSTTSNNPTHFYTYPGTYVAKLTIIGPGGCSSVSQKSIVVQGPRGSINYAARSLCKPYTVDFVAHAQDAIGFTWDFNDGNTITNNDSTMQHTYNDAGSYVPKILLIDNLGCRVPVAGSDSILAVQVKASFTVPERSNCDTASIAFINTTNTNDRGVTYKWNFGDGPTISTVVNPIHKYLGAGNYYPTLIATTITGCVDTFASTSPVKLAASPTISMAISANGCVPLTMSMQASIVNGNAANAQWYWQFGNGNTAAVQQPANQLFTAAGLHTISVKFTDSNQCSATASKIIEAYGLPATNAGVDSFVCKGRPIGLHATGASTYQWNNASTISCTNCASPLVQPLTDTIYVVKGISSNNCIAYDTVKIVVKNATKLIYRTEETICDGQSVKLFASGASTYSWTPTTGLKKPNIATPDAAPTATTTYRVVGLDNIAAGCSNDTGYVLVKVNTKPAVSAGMDKTTLAGAPIDLEARYTEDVTVVNWWPTDALSRNGYNTITVRPNKNTEYNVEVTNRAGCTAKDKVNVFVTCNDNNVFIPNTFSPNNDGSNDVFYPRGKGLVKIKSLRIYNRWGNVVFDKSSFNANDPSAGWDGTFKGTKLLADVFIYTMEVVCDGGFVLNYNGNISLLY